MEMTDLFKLLKEQHQFLEAFLNTIVLQQRAIIESDIKGLEETIKTEGALLINFEYYEKHMTQMICELSEKYSLNASSGKLSDFVNTLKGRREFNPKSFIKVQTSLQKLMMQIININSQNKLLVDQARNFIKETVSTFISNNQKPILDRKV